MIIKNLTAVQQPLTIKELTGDRSVYDIYVQPNGRTSIDKAIIVSPIDGIFAIEGCECCSKVEKVEAPVVEEKKVEEPTKVEEPVVEEKVEPIEETKAEEPAKSEFICDICGSEFASARSLAAHKNKAHAE